MALLRIKCSSSTFQNYRVAYGNLRLFHRRNTMSKEKNFEMARLGMYELSYPFIHVPLITGEGFELRLADKYYFSDHKVPCYEYFIYIDGIHAGVINVRIEKDFEKVREVGNIGIEIISEFFGQDLPAKATKSVLSLLGENGINSILITCDKGKKAIHEACKQLSARYLDTIATSTEDIQKDRFILDIG